MGVGKSCLLHQFTEKKFMADFLQPSIRDSHSGGSRFGCRLSQPASLPSQSQLSNTVSQAGRHSFRVFSQFSVLGLSNFDKKS